MYYKPAQGGSNLSPTGKLYHKKQPKPRYITIRMQRSGKSFLPLQQKLIDYFNLGWKITNGFFSKRSLIETTPEDWEIEYIKL